MRKSLAILLCFSLFYSAKAQQKLPSLDYVPQSPVTAAFTRYGDIPVDQSTGVPGISIPVYTLSGHGIDVPVTISYHASGVKVQDIASAVGLGWVLNAGGVITRSVFGDPDEYLDMKTASGQGVTLKPPFRNSDQFSQTETTEEGKPSGPFTWYSTLYTAYLNGKSTYDYYSDRYYYSLANGESGIFRRDYMTDVIRLIPYRPINIRFYWADQSYQQLMIEMTTADGTIYSFKRNRADLWHLDKIVNSGKTDSIVFYSHYETIAYNEFNDIQKFGVYKNSQIPRTEPHIVESNLDHCYNSLELQPDYTSPVIANVNSSLDEVVLIDSIVGSNAVIRFTYAQDRQDYQLPSQSVVSPHARLTEIQVFSKPSGTLIKDVTLSHSYSGDGLHNLSKRLMLDAVQIGANHEEKYSFKYNPEPMPPYAGYTENGTKAGFQEDLWGYKNREGSSTLLCAEFAPFGASNLFPDEDMAKACILQEMTYPTGGKTVFEYECNRVPANFYGFSSPKVPTDGKVGGLRVKKISNYAYEGASPQVKTYEYVFDMSTNYGLMWYDQFVYTQNTFNFYVEPGCEFQTQIFTNTSSCNVSMAKPFGRYIGSAQAPVIYSQVTEYNGDGTTNAGKTIYYYNMPDYHPGGVDTYEPRFAGPLLSDIGNYTPEIAKKEEYKNENGQYKLVRKTETSYLGIQTGTFLTGFNLASDLEFQNMTGDATDAFNNYNFVQQNWFYQTLHYSDNFGYTQLDLPYETSVYDYVDENNFVKTTSRISYNDIGLQTSVTATTSKGETVTTNYTHPADYLSQPPYNTMVDRHILSPIVEESTFKNNSIFLQSTKTNYNYWNWPAYSWGDATSNLILPQTVETKKGNNLTETRLRYYSYDDKGNPISLSKENDTRISYVWGYNKSYPIAKVTNASEDQIAYTSFEDEAFGNWLFTGGIPKVSDNTAPTGKLCLALAGVSLYKPNLTSSSSYIVSYWCKAGSSVNVSGNSSDMVTSPVKNGWIWVKRAITGTSSITITGSGYIDEVKLYPATAQMTAYTFEPLVGMTAQSDVTDRITYYEYDASGRLIFIRDEDRNILKRICYNYQGQPETCGINTTPLWQPTGVTRCKPCPQNSNYITNIQQQQERDNNANSDTYGSTRWTDAGVFGNCIIQPDWQYTGNTRCVIVSGQNTGEQEKEQTDVNPCSNYGQKRWISAGTNTTACPLPPSFQSDDVSGNYYSQNCSGTQVPTPYYVSMPQGSFTSLTSVADATNQALAEAQRRANTYGGCTTVYIKLVVENLPPDADGYEYVNYHFRFYSDAAGTHSITLPSDLVVNIQSHGYFTEDGGAPSDEGYSDGYLNGYAGQNEAEYGDFQTLACDGTRCFHQELILKPGRYVIIP